MSAAVNAGSVPLSLYVHLPWCVRKCPYCDFNSYPLARSFSRQRYLAALKRDLAALRPFAEGRELLSVFFGGGTPSLFAPDEIAAILAAVAAGFEIAADAEITLEANPGTLERARLAGYRAAGVNRLSLGAQSFAAEMLQILGRLHGPRAIAASVAEARRAGFDNVSLDLMYALPGQDLAMALDDLRAAADLEPEHIAWYRLTLEPNTVFHARPPAGLPDEDTAAAIQDAGEAALTRLGYSQYEVSAWARAPRHRSRHNLNYWTFGDYLAAGAGAHGKLTLATGIGRYARVAHPEAYMRAMERGEAAPRLEPVTAAALRFEYMLNALRLVEGLCLPDFVARTGLDAGQVVPVLEGLADRRLLYREADGRYRPSAAGRARLNDLMAEFLPDDAA